MVQALPRRFSASDDYAAEKRGALPSLIVGRGFARGRLIGRTQLRFLPDRRARGLKQMAISPGTGKKIRVTADMRKIFIGRNG